MNVFGSEVVPERPRFETVMGALTSIHQLHKKREASPDLP